MFENIMKKKNERVCFKDGNSVASNEDDFIR